MSEVHKCLTCNVRLNVTEENGKRTYMHAGQSTASDPEFFNHKPVPVPESEYDKPADIVCDFCSEPGPKFRYPCRPAENALMVFANDQGDTKVVDYRDNNPDWIACKGCHTIIQMEAIIGDHEMRMRLGEASLTRMIVVGRIRPADIDEVAPQVMFMHDLFFKNRYGSFEELPH